MRVRHLDTRRWLLTVDKSWDHVEGEQEPKSFKHTVPIRSKRLRRLLELWLEETGRSGNDFLLGPSPDKPFDPQEIFALTDAVWEEAEVNRVTMQDARAHFASYLAAGGVKLMAAAHIMGHSPEVFYRKLRPAVRGLA